MISVRIKESNVIMGSPEDWDSRQHGDCSSLFVRREERDGLPVLLSAWKPTALELEMLQSGASIILGVVGGAHPPVLMYVSEDD